MNPILTIHVAPRAKQATLHLSRMAGLLWVMALFLLPASAAAVHAADAASPASGRPRAPTDDFVLTVKTDNPGSSGPTQFRIPTYPGETYNYNVDCDDDGDDDITAATGDATCTYPVTGTYTLRVIDNTGAGTGFPRVYFNNEGDRLKLLSIDQWGTGQWTSMNAALAGCANLAGQAADMPDLSLVTDMSTMFLDATIFNGDIGAWDTSNVTSMSAMFANAAAFNADIGGWDTANVTDMSGMFYNVAAFNQDIGGWNTANVTDMSGMFYGAAAFNQNIGGWNVTSLTDADYMFFSAGLSTPNYDALLIGWGAQELQTGVWFDGGASTYCAGEASRAHMIAEHGWDITDAGTVCSADDFVLTVKSDNPGASGPTQFTIPTYPGESYNYNVDCNSDSDDDIISAIGDATCDYPAPGTYMLRIKDNTGAGTGFPRVYFNNEGDRLKLLSIDQWGAGHWTSMNAAFAGCANLNGQVTDMPDLSLVTDMSDMFALCIAFNPGPDAGIGSWDTANVTNMFGTFFAAAAFNQDIGGWNMANVANMREMFAGAAAFNRDIGGWNTANVADMSQMFASATAFNQDISGWNVANVTDMGYMFSDAVAFNQDIGGWDTSNVTDMGAMFAYAAAFNQNIGNWNVAALTNAGSMFLGAGLTMANYDALLIGWGAQDLQSGVPFDGGSSTYCAGKSARAHMIAEHGWIITDGGSACYVVYLPVVTRAWRAGGAGTRLPLSR